MCMFVCTAGVREGITLYVYVCVYCDCERRDGDRVSCGL